MTGILPHLSALVLALPAGAAADTCSPADRAFLTALTGAWVMEASVRVEPGRFEDATGSVRATTALDGCAVIAAAEFEVAGAARSEVHVLAAAADGRFELSAVDSDHGSFTVSTGRRAEEVLVLEWSRELGDRVLRTRKEYRLDADGALRVEHLLSRSLADPWEIVLRASYRRP